MRACYCAMHKILVCHSSASMTRPSPAISKVRLAATETRVAPPVSSAAALTLGYTLATLPLLALGGSGGDACYPAIAAGHVALVAALAASLRGAGTAARAARGWLPLVAIPLLYAELPFLMAAVGTGFGDAAVQRLEFAVWGGHPARWLAGAAPWTWLSEALHLAYLSYYGIIYAPLAWLWWRAWRGGDDPGFAEASLAVMATFFACFAVFVAFPVQGPRFLWPSPEGIPGGPVRTLVLGILERGSSRGAAFPSSHMAVAVVQALMAFRWRVPGRSLIAVLSAGLGVGAVYGGFHYAIDMIAGALAGAAVYLAVRGWGARSDIRG